MMTFKPTHISLALFAAFAASANNANLANFSVLSKPSAETHLVQFHSGLNLSAPNSVAKAGLQGSVAARNHLNTLVERQRLNAADLVGLELRSVHDTGRGAIVVRYGQSLNGIPVLGSEMAVVMDRHYQLVATSGQLSSAVATSKKQQALNKTNSMAFTLTPQELVSKAFGDLGGNAQSISSIASKKAGRQQFKAISTGEVNLQRAGAEQVYFATEKGLVPAYKIELQTTNKGTRNHQAFAFVYSAQTGELLSRKNQTQNESFGYKVFADSDGTPWDGPQKRLGHPHPTGLKGQNFFPSFSAPNMVVLESGPFSTLDPWLNPGAMVTSGNNADAYVDQIGADGYQVGDVRAAVNSTLPGGENAFDYTLNTTIAANANDSQKMAAATEMFYMINWLHDDFYGHGFNEAAGNAQVNNYGRGGAGNDALLAEAQDKSGFNNANMSTPSDGESPTMQMYLYTYSGDSKLTINSPVMSPINATTAAFGPDRFAAITADLVLLSDGVVGSSDTATGTVNDGCETPSNSSALNGKVALIERGFCNFTVKVKNAQTAGARAVVIYNNIADAMIGMAGDDATISIPAIGINQSDGVALKAIAANVTVQEPNPSRDSSFDALTIAHEWGHYITNRMIGDGFGLGNNQGGSMGEGWGDFHALLLTVEEQDLTATSEGWAAKWSMGGYSDQGKTPNEAYFSGIRGWPYTTDMSSPNGNSLTFAHIKVDPEVHGSGTFWATVLWDCYASLLTNSSLTFADAQARMKDYIVAAYAATPSNPTFTEARDALLAVVRANSVTDYSAMAAAFARRGMGVGAVSPDRFSEDHVGVVESFKTSASASFSNISFTLTKDTDADGILDVGDEADVNFSATSDGFTALNNASVALSASGVAASGSVNIGAIAVGASQSAAIHITLNSASFAQELNFTLTASDSAIDASLPVSKTFKHVVNYDLIANQSTIDGDKNVIADWTQDLALGDSSVAVTIAGVSGSRYYLIPDAPVRSDLRFVSPEFDVGSSDQFMMSWQQAFKFEASDPGNGVIGYWDGGVVEYSVNGGAWTDAGNALSPSYNATLYLSDIDPTSSSVLGGHQAYSATSTGFPTLQNASLNLAGKGLGGQKVRVRFRATTDSNTGDQGWRIDNVSLSGISNNPFSNQAVNGSLGAAPTTPTIAALAIDYTIASGATTVSVPVSWTASSGDVVSAYSLLVDGVVVLTSPFTPSSGAINMTTNYAANSEGTKQFVIRLCNGSVCVDSAAVSTTIKKAAKSSGGGGGGSLPWLAVFLLAFTALRRKSKM